MRKERVSATQLVDMITSQIGASGVEVSVRKDHAYGWQPTILAAPNEAAHRPPFLLCNRRLRWPLGVSSQLSFVALSKPMLPGSCSLSA